MGRRTVKEYRAAEALQLALADRDKRDLECPSCGGGKFDRSPKRRLNETPGELYRQVKLTCQKCGRSAVYAPHRLTQSSEPQTA